MREVLTTWLFVNALYDAPGAGTSTSTARRRSSSAGAAVMRPALPLLRGLSVGSRRAPAAPAWRRRIAGTRSPTILASWSTPPARRRRRRDAASVSSKARSRSPWRRSRRGRSGELGFPFWCVASSETRNLFFPGSKSSKKHWKRSKKEPLDPFFELLYRPVLLMAPTFDQ